MAILIAAPFIVALLLPRKFDIERMVVIDRPKDQVFKFAKSLANQKQYTTWFKTDPKMRSKLSGNDGTVGAVFAWESDDQNVGVGEQEIKAIQEGKQIDFEIRIRKPFESNDPSSTIIEAVSENQTRVKSIYHGKMSYPTNLLCSLVCTKVGEDMQLTLQNLKQVMERQSSDDTPEEDKPVERPVDAP